MEVPFINSKYRLNYLHTVKRGKQDQSDPYVLIIDSLKQLSTNFVTSNMFNYKNVSEIIKLTVQMLETMIQNYVHDKNLLLPPTQQIKSSDILFLYKGGNVFRSLFVNYTKLLPADKSLLEEYKDLIKMSDLDFQILIKPNINDFDKVFDDLSERVFDVLCLIKTRVLNDPITFGITFNFQNDILIDFVDKLNMKLSELFKNDIHTYKIEQVICGNSYYSKIPIVSPVTQYDYLTSSKKYIFDVNKISSDRNNVVMTLSGGDNVNIYEITNDSMMYVTYNDVIEFSHNFSNVKFNLIRIKINIVAIINIDGAINAINIPGEFIDIAIPHKTTRELTKYFADPGSKKFSEDYATYVYKNMEDIKFKSYSVRKYIEDLHDILYEYNKYPWDSHKHTKQIIRYVTLLLFYLIDNHRAYSKPKTLIDELVTFIIFNRMSRATIDMTKPLASYLTKLADLNDSIDPSDKKLVAQFNNHLNIVLSVVIQFFLAFGETQTVDLPALTITDITQLGGSYRKKYLKYKQKYLLLKNQMN